MRRAADFGENQRVNESADNQQRRLAMHQHDDACSEQSSNEEMNQRGPKQIHGCSIENPPAPMQAFQRDAAQIPVAAINV